MLKTTQFYSIWVMYLCASSTGLMIIVNITSIASAQAGMTDAAHLVVILALFDTSDRVFAGMLCDKMGGLKALSLSFMLSIANMMLFPHYTSHISLIIGMATADLCYGTLPAVFPSLTAGFCGLKIRYKLWCRDTA